MSNEKSHNNCETENALSPFVPMDVIRNRVDSIKEKWSASETRSRANEGQRRREELEMMLLDVVMSAEADFVAGTATDRSANDALSLVG